MNTGTRRLLSQGLGDRPFARPEDVVRHMGAMQAQDYAQAIWGVAVRTAQSTLADVETAIAERRIVRTWPMRSTIHFVPPEDAKWMLALSAPRRLAAARSRLAQLEIDAATLERSAALLASSLQGGNRLTRPAVMALLDGAGISTDGQRGYHLVWHAAQTGLICFGPMEGKQQTFVLLDEWVPHARRLEGDAALAELAKRYFLSHGPATVNDFAWWAGLTLTDARRGLAAAGPGLVCEAIAGRDMWLAQDPHDTTPPTGPHVRLLPGFDEFLLGYTDRSDVLGVAHAPHIVPGGNGVFKPTVVAGGQVVGTWRKRATARALHVEVASFRPLDGQEEALHHEAGRVAAAAGLPLASLTVTPLR
jgi:hypothetical protein